MQTQNTNNADALMEDINIKNSQQNASDLNFTTWEMEVKTVPKVNMEVIIKAFDKKNQFFTENSFLLNTPFIILHRPDLETDDQTNLGWFFDSCELMCDKINKI